MFDVSFLWCQSPLSLGEPSRVAMQDECLSYVRVQVSENLWQSTCVIPSPLTSSPTPAIQGWGLPSGGTLLRNGKMRWGALGGWDMLWKEVEASQQAIFLTEKTLRGRLEVDKTTLNFGISLASPTHLFKGTSPRKENEFQIGFCLKYIINLDWFQRKEEKFHL